MLKINDWLEKERQLGSTSSNRVVLATASENGEVHSRIVAIKELNDKGIVFLRRRTQKK